MNQNFNFFNSKEKNYEHFEKESQILLSILYFILTLDTLFKLLAFNEKSSNFRNIIFQLLIIEISIFFTISVIFLLISLSKNGKKRKFSDFFQLILTIITVVFYYEIDSSYSSSLENFQKEFYISLEGIKIMLIMKIFFFK